MILKKELERIKGNTSAIANVEQALAVLEDNRILYFLRAFGRPIREPKSTYESMALDGSYAAGWQDCLDTLLNFKEIFLLQTKQVNLSTPDYGGRRRLLEQGDITQEEYDNGYTNRSGDAQRSGGK